MWLRVETGPDAGKSVRIAGDTFVVGRGRGCDFVLAGDGVDRQHARFEAVGHGRYVLRDLGTERGTFLAGRRIRGPVEVRGDEQLCFGDTFARLLAVEPSAKKHRTMVGVAVAAAAVVVAAGITAGVLAPRTGGGPGDAVNHAAAPPPAPPAAPPEPAAATVEAPPTVEPEADAEPPAIASAETQEENAGRAVFREDFSDPQSGWEVFSVPTVTAGYERGAYEIQITDATWYATVDSGRRFNDPSVTVSVQNPGRASFAGFGILCNYRDESRFDVLAVGTDGTFAILQQRAGALTVLSEGGEWARSPRIPVGAERYRLRADCRGRVLRLWVNGRVVATAATDAPGGRIGLFAAGLAHFRFDDVVVESAGTA